MNFLFLLVAFYKILIPDFPLTMIFLQFSEDLTSFLDLGYGWSIDL